MMLLTGVVVVCSAVSVHAGWLHELALGRGLNLGSGISLHLDRLKRENASLLERHALRLDYSGVGLSVGKAMNKDAVQVGLYVDGEVEGRKKKVGEVLVPAIIGFKATGVAVLMFTGATLLVFKALGIAKLAFLVSAGMLIAKYLHHESESTPYVEIEHHPSMYHSMHAEYPSATGYSSGDVANYYSYANYGESGHQGVETAAQYSIVEAPHGNSSIVAVPASKRHDALRRKVQPVPIITLEKYTIKH